MQLYDKLSKALNENEFDELGLLQMLPEMTELPSESEVYYPLVVIETKLGIGKAALAELLKQAHERFISLSPDNHKEMEQVTRVMVLLKPDNYTAMNRRKELMVLGYIEPKQELSLIGLIFTIPKHSKSSVAWYHRQWIFKKYNQDKVEIDIEVEFKLSTMAAALYPRNYYAWTYRYWVLSTFCKYKGDSFMRDEYNSTCHWIKTNISDYSGFQYLQQLMKMLKLDTDSKGQERHMNWLDLLIVKYPGYESLWCHRRFCSNLFFYLEPELYSNKQHGFIDDIVNDRLKHKSLSDKQDDFEIQKMFALKFGLWQTLLEKRCHSPIHTDKSKMELYQSVAPISGFL